MITNIFLVLKENLILNFRYAILPAQRSMVWHLILDKSTKTQKTQLRKYVNLIAKIAIKKFKMKMIVKNIFASNVKEFKH